MQQKQEQMELYESEGFVSGIVDGIVALVAGVAVITLILIMVGVLGGQAYNVAEPDIDAISNNIVSSFNFSASNSTATALHTYVQTGTLVIVNNTNFAPIGLGNFTIDYTAGTLLLTNNNYNSLEFIANYTWGDLTIRNYVKDGIISGFKAQKQTGTYMPLIILAIIITIVLSLILGLGQMSSGGMGRGSAL